MGDPRAADAFLATRWPEVTALSDPDKDLYHAFGLNRGSLASVAGPKVWVASVKAILSGHGVGRPVGDTLQMSGWFLIDGHTVRWRHVHASSGEERDYAGLEQALRQLGAR